MQLPFGAILEGDIAFYDIYNSRGTNYLFSDPKRWVTQPQDQNTFARVRSLLEAIKKTLKDPQNIRTLEKRIHVDSFLKYIALQDRLGSHHVDRFHNHKMYFNPTTKKLHPIAWDILPFDRPRYILLQAGRNELYQAILSSSPNRLRKNKILWNMLNTSLNTTVIKNKFGGLLQHCYEVISASIFKFHVTDTSLLLLRNSSWQRELVKFRRTLERRDRELRAILNSAEIETSEEANGKDHCLRISASSFSDLVLLSIEGKLISKTPQQSPKVKVKINTGMETQDFYTTMLIKENNLDFRIALENRIPTSGTWLINGPWSPTPTVHQICISSPIQFSNFESITLKNDVSQGIINFPINGKKLLVHGVIK